MGNDLNKTPSANRVHIGFFGRRNAGKSSLVNAVTGQNMAIVSDVRGTTTDPVSKAMELLPLGPVVIIDTPGIDDEGELGGLRVRRSYQMLNKTDIAILVVDASLGMQPEDKALLERIREKEIPCLVVYTKCDLLAQPAAGSCEELPSGTGHVDNTVVDAGTGHVDNTVVGADTGLVDNTAVDVGTGLVDSMVVSARTGEKIFELKERIAALAKNWEDEKKIISDLLSPEDIVILVTPIDSSAPKGRMILPQVQTIRDILDVHAAPLVTQTQELPAMLCSLKKPPFAVVTDSQDFAVVMKMVPEDVPLTSFSILMARRKGILETAAKGAFFVSKLRDGDTVLISEGCTHHRQCEDIGTVKLPNWIRKYTGKDLQFAFTSGTEFPDDLSEYALVVHCGGCMLNEREMRYRMKCCMDQGIPYTNYGTLIAHMNGILQRSLFFC